MMIYLTLFDIIIFWRSLSRSWLDFLKNTFLKFSLLIADVSLKKAWNTIVDETFLDGWEPFIFQK